MPSQNLTQADHGLHRGQPTPIASGTRDRHASRARHALSSPANLNLTNIRSPRTGMADNSPGLESVGARRKRAYGNDSEDEENIYGSQDPESDSENLQCMTNPRNKSHQKLRQPSNTSDDENIDPDLFASSPSPKPRQSIRDTIRESKLGNKPRTYKKRVGNDEYAKDVEPQLAELQLASRFAFLQYFSSQFSDHIIRQVYGPDIQDTDYTYDIAYRRIQSYCKNWKYSSLLAAKAHVQDIVKLDETRGDVLKHMSTDEAIGQYFTTQYSPENFTTVFPFLYKYLDVRGSSEFGQYYLKNIYANLCAQALQHVRWKATGEVGDKYNDKALSRAYNDLATNPTWDDLESSDFARHRRNTVSKKKRRSDSPEPPSRFVLYGPPPAKAIASRND